MTEIFVLGSFWFWALLAVELIFLVLLLESDQYGTATFSILVCLGLLFFFGLKRELADLASWVVANPLLSLAFVGVYFLVGTFYVCTPYVGKWWWFVRDIRDLNRRVKQEWLSERDNKVAILESRYKDRIVVNQAEATVPRDENGRILNYADTARGSAFTTDDLHNELEAWLQCKGEMTDALLPYWKKFEANISVPNKFGGCVSIVKPTPEKFKSKIISWIVYWPPSMAWTLINDPVRRIGRIIYDGVADTLKIISEHAWKDEDLIK